MVCSFSARKEDLIGQRLIYVLSCEIQLGQSKFTIYFPVTILSLNIAEAVYREFEVFLTYKTLTVDAGGILIQGGYWNVINGISGIFSIILLTGFVGIKVSQDKSRDMVWPDMTWIYIVAYTLWNFAYVYNCISTRAMYAGAGILLVAFLSEVFFKKGVWLQHRAQILSVYAMFSLSFDYQKYDFFQIIPTYKPIGLWTISIIAFVFNVVAFIYMVGVIRRDRVNPLKTEIYTQSKYYQDVLKENNLTEKRSVHDLVG